MNQNGDTMLDSDKHGDRASDGFSSVISLIIGGLIFNFFGAVLFAGFVVSVLGIALWHLWLGAQAVRDGR